MSTETTIKLPGTPKPWMNRIVMATLRTPGLRSMLGKSFLILTVTGAKSGRRYTTPVQYMRDGDRLLVLSPRHRRWSRNIAERPNVEMVLAGETMQATARLAEGEEAREALATALRLNPRIAKFYDIEMTGGEPDPAGVEQLDTAFAVIIIDRV